MKHDIEILRALVDELKAAPIFSKADKAEKIMDRVIACLDDLDQRVEKIEQRQEMLPLKNWEHRG
jgi:hypothetical protein